MKTLRILLLLVSFSILSSGCLTTATGFNSLKVGMSPPEVVAVLGQPSSKIAEGREEVYVYKVHDLKFVLDGDIKEYWVHFTDGRVTTFGGAAEIAALVSSRSAPSMGSSTPKQSGPSIDDLERLKLLVQLRDQGAISNEEFEKQKAVIMTGSK